MWKLTVILIASATLLIACNGMETLSETRAGNTTKPTSPSGVANTARDPEIAILEEYDLAVRKNSTEAYDLFISRHPDHRLALEAKTRKNVLLTSTQ